MSTISVSVEQRFELFSKLGANMNWNGLTPEQVQVGIADPQRAGREFEAFVRSGFRVQIGDFLRETGEVRIEIPALPRPTEEQLRTRFSWIREENGIERDTSSEGPVTLVLGTVLRPDEPSISGPEYELRIAPKLNLALGLQHSDWIVEHQDDQTPEFAALRTLRGKVYIDFLGLIVVDGDGDRRCPYVNDGGERFGQSWSWMGSGLNQGGRIALSGK